MKGPLDITYLEQAWEAYQDTTSDAYKDILLAWMGSSMGLVLQEIRILRTQAKGLQVSLKEERQKRQESEFDYMMDVEV